MNKYLKQIKEGIVDQNPTFMQFLGMCPTLATTTSVSNAVGMGLAATAVLICSNVIISLLRKFIPKEIRIASYIVIISGFVTAVELLMKAYLQSLYDSLGLYIPLIVVNCIILARAEAFASKNPVLPSAIDGLAMGLGFTVSLTVIGSVREILGAGTWLGLPIMGDWYTPATIFILPAGAFLTLGVLAALVNRLKAYAAAHPRPEKVTAEDVAVLPDDVVTDAPSDTDTQDTNTDVPETPVSAETSDTANAPENEEDSTASIDTAKAGIADTDAAKEETPAAEAPAPVEEPAPTAESSAEAVPTESTTETPTESEETNDGTAD